MAISRVIEFRAWHPRTGMHDAKKMTDNGLTMMFDGRFLYGNFVAEGGWEIMQFTGLHDKNGVKIFEGDVIHLQWIHNYTGSVEFKNGTFNMVSAEKEIIVRALGELFSHNISVIGSIHQNPELLEKKQ